MKINNTNVVMNPINLQSVADIIDKMGNSFQKHELTPFQVMTGVVPGQGVVSIIESADGSHLLVTT